MTSAAPTFSIIVVTYNYADYLPRALDSICAQEGDDFETLAVDDGSTDATAKILARYAPRVRCIRQEHAGTFHACRTGARAARGKYVLFLDADDRLLPGALAALRGALEKQPQARLILAGARSVARDGSRKTQRAPRLSPAPQANFARFVRGSLRASLAGGVIDRALLLPFDREGFNYPHGTDRALLAYALLHPSASIDSVNVEVYDHPGRLREDIFSIDRSGLKLADLLFDEAIVPREVLPHRRRFTALLEASRGRAYFRARWYGKAWRSYAQAARLAPVLVARPAILRRAIASWVKDFMRFPEGPARKVPGHLLLGNHRQLWGDPFSFLRECARRHGPVTRLRLPHPTYFLAEPDDLHHVLVTCPERYHKTGIQRAYSLLAGGMIGKDGPAHREQRRIVQPSFHKREIAKVAAMAENIAERRLRAIGDRADIDAMREAKQLCADLAGRFVFGCEDAKQIDRLVFLAQHTHQFAAAEFRRWLQRPAWLRTRRRRRYATFIRELDEWLEPLAAERQRRPADDLLSVILKSASPGTLPMDLRERVTMLFLAALDPVANTLAWAARLLADHPAVQERIVDEVESERRSSDAGAADVFSLRYTSQVLDEVLRLYPNEWLLTRRAVEEDRLPSGARIRRGEEVMVSPYVVQRDARFFPDPDRFDPDRFAAPPRWPSMAYIPFGAGPRMCLGEFYARAVILTSLTKIVPRWRIEPIEPMPPLETGNMFSSQPRGGRLLVRFTIRR